MSQDHPDRGLFLGLGVVVLALCAWMLVRHLGPTEPAPAPPEPTPVASAPVVPEPEPATAPSSEPATPKEPQEATKEPEPEVNRADLLKVIETAQHKLAHCFATHAERKASVNMMVSLIISPTGHVMIAKVVSSTHKQAKVEQCVAHEYRKLRFPPRKGGAPITINMPLAFAGRP